MYIYVCVCVYVCVCIYIYIYIYMYIFSHIAKLYFCFLVQLPEPEIQESSETLALPHHSHSIKLSHPNYS